MPMTLQDSFGFAYIFLELRWVLRIRSNMGVPMACDLVARVVNTTQKIGEALGDPTEHEERRVDVVGIEQCKYAVGVFARRVRVSNPIGFAGHGFRRRRPENSLRRLRSWRLLAGGFSLSELTRPPHCRVGVT